MNIGPVLVLRGAILGSLAVALLGFTATAGVAPLNQAASAGLQAAAVFPAAASAVEAECQVSGRFPDEILRWCELITSSARHAGLPPDLIAAVILQESGGDPLAYSHSGAVGLMQVMPRDGLAAAFRCNGKPCFASRPTIEELQDAEYNVAYGTRMLAALVTRLGSVREALRAYGPMDVGYDYADKVLSLYNHYGITNPH